MNNVRDVMLRPGYYTLYSTSSTSVGHLYPISLLCYFLRRHQPYFVHPIPWDSSVEQDVEYEASYIKAEAANLMCHRLHIAALNLENTGLAGTQITSGKETHGYGYGSPRRGVLVEAENAPLV